MFLFGRGGCFPPAGLSLSSEDEVVQKAFLFCDEESLVFSAEKLFIFCGEGFAVISLETGLDLLGRFWLDSGVTAGAEVGAEVGAGVCAEFRVEVLLTT